jgi:hypothetical protein
MPNMFGCPCEALPFLRRQSLPIIKVRSEVAVIPSQCWEAFDDTPKAVRWKHSTFVKIAGVWIHNSSAF